MRPKRLKRSMKYYRRRFKKRASHITTRRNGYLLPDRQMVKLAYTYMQVDSTDVAGLYARTFSGNSLFDPDPSVGGAQPTGFDQYAAFYRFYHVAGCKIRLEFINTDSSSVIQCGVVPGTNQLAAGDLTVMYPLEWPYSVERTLGPLTSSFSRCMLNRYMSTKKIYGYKTSNNGNYISAVSASPTNQWYWNIWVRNAAAAAVPFRIKIKLVYYCHFFGRQEIEVS